MKRFLIERDIPKVGSLSPEQMRAAAAKSNSVLHELGPHVQWIESYVAADKLFCVYLAEDSAIVKEHADRSGFYAAKITEIVTVIDPTTEHSTTLRT